MEAGGCSDVIASSVTEHFRSSISLSCFCLETPESYIFWVGLDVVDLCTMHDGFEVVSPDCNFYHSSTECSHLAESQEYY